jgi:acetyl esterase/lipase
MPTRPTTAALAILGLLSGAGAVALTPVRHAGAPMTVVRTNAIRASAPDSTPDGSLTTTVTYTAAAASAEASTADTVRLARGLRFKLTTCLTYHRRGSAPIARCADRYVDTRPNPATIRTGAPTVRLPDQPRPSGAASWAYFAGYTQVAFRSGSGVAAGGGYTVAAHSWPGTGLQGAGIAVAGRGRTWAALPANEPVLPDGVDTGAINSGAPDGICRASFSPTGGRLPPGVTTGHPAFARAPAYYEVGEPTGSFTGQQPLGVMLVIHGGGWYSDGPGATRSGRPVADRWRARGWETVNLTYRACGQSLGDVLWFYDRTRAWFGPSATVCASGASAGGQLALMLATKRRGVYCVVSEGGPTDLRLVQNQTAFDAATGAVDQTRGGRMLHNLAAAAFGEENLASVSPAALAAGLKNTRVLQGFALTDPLVPYEQATDLRLAMLAANPGAYVDTAQLAPGPVSFVHANVSRPALADFIAREDRLVAPVSAMRPLRPEGTWGQRAPDALARTMVRI